MLIAKPDVSIIVATTMESHRLESLERAVDSILSASERSLPILAVNGPHVDTFALARWQARNDVQLHRLEEGSYLKARLFGRRQVKTEYFGFLDDDDILLQDSVSQRLQEFHRDSSVDVVVGNGFAMREGQKFPVLTCIDMHRNDPLQGLSLENWLASCAGLFRTQTIGEEFFSYEDYHLEWTALAMRLSAARKNIIFIDAITYLVNDTPASLSKSSAYQLGLAHTLRRLLDLPIPHASREVWRRKYGAALHQLADYHWMRGNYRRAWRPHLQSLCQPGGWKYLSFTRRLFESSSVETLT